MQLLQKKTFSWGLAYSFLGTLLSQQGAWWHAGTHGAGEIAERYILICRQRMRDEHDIGL